ncbi:MAG: hypothetical protein ABJS83_18725, partial [Alphaproteobacteria bacterium]
EGGFGIARLDVTVAYELDVTLTAPATVLAVEDGDGADSSGVTVDLAITVAATDFDGSEDTTTVEIAFGDLPAGATASTGTLDAGTGLWTGSMAQANALSLHLPADYSGTITSAITAISPEGQISTAQTITIAPAGDIDFDIQELVAAETDARVVLTPSDAWAVAISDSDPNLPRETLDTVTLTLADLPPAVLALGVPASTITYNAAAGGALTFTGTEAQYLALQLSFPADYSTESPAADGLVLDGTLSATSSEDAAGQTTPVTLRITPEGDVEIDTSQPDTVPDETDAATPVVPADLLLPAVTDADGSEALQTLLLTIAGLPAGADLPGLGITLPAGAIAHIDDDATTGAATLSITLNAADVGDVMAAYQALALSLPADFSTANRADLTNGSTSLPLTLTLDVQTNEDQDQNTDTPTDGTATATRIVDIAYEPDIDLTAPRLRIAAEDDGVPVSDQGVDVDLGIEIAITDIDGSETEDPADPRFAARVEIAFASLPTGSTANGGTLDVAAGLWTGTVAEAEALILSLPGNYNGTILSTITVITPEGVASAPQAIVVTPTPDIVIDGTIVTTETDAPVEVLLSDFISVLVSDPNETIQSLSFALPGLPPQMQALDGAGNDVGTFTDAGDGTFTFDLTIAAGDTLDPADVRLVFPTDYATENPATTLEAALTVTTSDGTATGDIPVVINVEGDVSLADATLALTETDAPVIFRPSDSITPRVTDADGSESIQMVAVAFNALPPGTQVSTDGGTSFAPLALPTLNFIGTLAEYQNLVLSLPTDYSTQNPATTLFAEIAAVSDEGGFGIARLDVTVAYELDVTLTAPATVLAVEDGDGADSSGVTVDLA